MTPRSSEVLGTERCWERSCISAVRHLQRSKRGGCGLGLDAHQDVQLLTWHVVYGSCWMMSARVEAEGCVER